MALTDKLTSIADAIRAKGSTTDMLTLDGMVDAINAIEIGSVATDVTDSIVSVAFSATNSLNTYTGFVGIIPEDAKTAILFWQGDESNAVNNQCLFAVLQRVYINDGNVNAGAIMYCRLKNSSYDFQSGSYAAFDFIVNAGDTFRMVVIR